MASNLKKAFYAEEKVLQLCNCTVEKLPLEGRLNEQLVCDVLIHPSGWKFYARHGPILGGKQIEQATTDIKLYLLQNFDSIKTELNETSEEAWLNNDHLDVNECKLHLPPMLFGLDVLNMQYRDQCSIDINPIHAILSWVVQHTQETMAQTPLQVPKVPYADKWLAKFHQGVRDHPESQKIITEECPINHIQTSDWTYSTDYCLTLTDWDSNKTPDILTARHFQPNNTNSNNNITIVPESKSGIDFEMLQRRDIPILFFDEFTLYEDDLEDCGTVTIEAKIRVMPTCWFVLLTFFLRIDGVLLRSRETRLYHRFPTTTAIATTTAEEEATTTASSEEIKDNMLQVHCEVLWREQKLGNIDNIVGYETARQAVPAGSPFKTIHLRTIKDDNKDIPIVNDKEGIQQFYTISFPLAL